MIIPPHVIAAGIEAGRRRRYEVVRGHNQTWDQAETAMLVNEDTVAVIYRAMRKAEMTDV